MKIKIYSFKPHLHLTFYTVWSVALTCDVHEVNIMVLLGWCFHGVQKVYNCLLDNESWKFRTSAELLIGFPLLYSGALKGAMQSLDIMGSKPLNSHTASRSCIWSICIFSLHITDTHIVLILCFFIYNVPRCWYCCP